jgi:hypothetical protein
MLRIIASLKPLFAYNWLTLYGGTRTNKEKKFYQILDAPEAALSNHKAYILTNPNNIRFAKPLFGLTLALKPGLTKSADYESANDNFLTLSVGRIF